MTGRAVALVIAAVLGPVYAAAAIAKALIAHRIGRRGPSADELLLDDAHRLRP